MARKWEEKVKRGRAILHKITNHEPQLMGNKCAHTPGVIIPNVSHNIHVHVIHHEV